MVLGGFWLGDLQDVIAMQGTIGQRRRVSTLIDSGTEGKAGAKGWERVEVDGCYDGDGAHGKRSIRRLGCHSIG